MTFRERLEAARLESAKAYERAQSLEAKALAKGAEPMEQAARDKMARRMRPDNPRPGPMAWKLGRALLPWLRQTFVNDWPFEDDTGFETTTTGATTMSDTPNDKSDGISRPFPKYGEPGYERPEVILDPDTGLYDVIMYGCTTHSRLDVVGEREKIRLAAVAPAGPPNGPAKADSNG